MKEALRDFFRGDSTPEKIFLDPFLCFDLVESPYITVFVFGL